MAGTVDKNANTAPVREIGSFVLCADIPCFAKAVESAAGMSFDLASVTALNSDFVQATPTYLLLNIKEQGNGQQDNLLFLTENKSYVFADDFSNIERAKDFEDVLEKPFGKGTVLCFLILDKVLERHKKYLEDLIASIRKLEEKFDHAEYRKLAFEFERLSDRLEEYHDLILELQERRIKQIETQYISFDYRVLIAESLSLQGRCRRRFASMRELRQEHATKATEELNTRIVKLNDVVKRLTAITVILMLPTLIASHFGMNFQFMPELHIWWAYPVVVAVQVIIVVVSFFIFKKIEWL